jgi:CubicO group peptidase (beta-lactamase class C family)
MKYILIIPQFYFLYFTTFSQTNHISTQVEMTRKVTRLKFDSIFTQLQDIYELPGFAVGIIKDDKVIYAKGFGVKEIGKLDSVNSESLFHMASLSKPFVAMAIMQLVDKKKIKLEALLTDYIPYFKMKDVRYTKITIKQMLTHTSGFPDVKDYGWTNPQFDENAVQRYIKDSVSNYDLLFEPGASYSYSNMAYDLLSEVIKQVSGMPFETYMTKYVFRPCKMMNSTFLRREANVDLTTSPHVFGDNCTFQVSVTYPYNRVHAGSSTLHSNIVDMLKWARLVLNKGNFEGKQIISAKSLKSLLSPEFKFDEQSSVGFGLFIDTWNGKRLLNHSGSDIGYSTYIGIIPEDSVAIVFMSNLHRFVPYDAIANITFTSIYNDPSERPKKPINLAIGQLICKEGFAKAKEKYFTLKQNSSDVYDFSEEWLNTLGYAFVTLKNLGEAINVLELNAEVYPNSVSCFENLGDIYILNHQNDKGRACYKNALKLDPKCEDCRVKLNKMY